jgi:hypothetical protein
MIGGNAMAEIHFKAFLSCSFAKEDSEVIDYFRKLVQAFDIEPLVYDYQEVGRLSDKIKENIANSDCLIAIATQRKRVADSERWTCSDWIQQEIALAHSYSKPIAIFVEEGVLIDGLIAMEERRETFTREDLGKGSEKITKFLFALHKHLEATYEAGLLHVPGLLRHYIRSRLEVLSSDSTVERTEILMESLVDSLEATFHSIELEESTPGLSVKPKDFNFKCMEKPSHVKVEVARVMETDHKFFWKILFSPPLKIGERVRYAYKEVLPNYRPYTYEELIKRIEAGTYEYVEPKCEGCEWTIVYPTYELRHEFELPENYEIEKYHSDVVIGPAKTKTEGEAKRISEGNMFVAERMFDKWVLKLTVSKPLLNHTYYTYYVPARVQEK